MIPSDLIPFGLTAGILCIGYRLFYRRSDSMYGQYGYLGLAIWYGAVLLGAIIGILASGTYP